MANNQGRGNGGNNRGGNNNRQQEQHHQPMQQNEVVTAQEKLNQVLQALDERGEELAGVLPRDVTLTAFLANVNQALRNNPKLLRCTFSSIVNACVKAAYDGLRIDGKEAAIVDAKESYKDGGAWKERDVARYMPMVFGLIKQILQSGAALTVKAVIVYQRELTTINPVDGKPHFMLLEGTTPGIHHAPILFGEKGDPVGCYSIAEIQRGIFKFEWMDRIAILDVQKEAKTDKVWKRWPTEMWKKTVIRRLRKSLAGTSQIRDMEAAEMFAQFDRTQPHPQLASPMTTPRPMRALPNQVGTESGVPLDLGSGDEGEMMDADRAEQRERDRGGNQQRQQDEPREQQRQQTQEPEVQLPEDDTAWGVWGTALENKIRDATTLEEVDRAWREAQPIFKHAGKAIRDRLTAKVTERNADLALDEAGAGAGGGDN